MFAKNLELTKAIKEYATNRINEENLSSVYSDGLELFMKFPSARYAALFILDENEFEFNLEKTNPKKIEENAEEAFGKLSEKGALGIALRDKKSVADDAKFNGAYHIVCPLLKFKGVNGLVILSVGATPKEYTEELYECLNVIASIYSSTIENFILRKKFQKNKDLLDQQVAYRTMKLVENQKNMAEKFESLRSNLSMSIPHEVRTPINQILGFADFLLKYYETTEVEEAHEMLEDIHTSATRLKKLFENYLFFANLSILSTNVYDIMQLQREVAPDAKSLIFETAMMKLKDCGREEDLSLDLAECAIAMSEIYLRKMTEEIIDNAIKYSEPGKKIEIVSEIINSEDENQGDLCEIAIRDYGKGMTEEQIKNIDAYMQFDRKVSEQQGSGLGLSIVRRIIDLHNGYFKIDSEADKYTQITVRLPAADFSEE